LIREAAHKFGRFLGLNIYDITRPITPQLAGWPGDTQYSAKEMMRIQDGHSVNLSTLTLSAHLGTHVDAPYHFEADGMKMNDVDLSAYVGPSTVVDFRDVDGALTPEHLGRVDLDKAERLLIHTKYSLVADDQWYSDFVYPTPEAAQLMVDHGIKLFGTDSPSVDPETDKLIRTHKTFGRGNIYILEGLQLTDVPAGEYELTALPLKLDGDGSPVRAILRG